MSNISKNQNKQENIDYLISQRFFYSKAKKIRNFRLIVSIIFALTSPFIVFFYKDYITIIGCLAGFWTLLDQIFKRMIEAINIEKAAIIQEEFDTKLFKMEWNNILCGNKISHEEISYAKRNFKGDISKLQNWYEGIGTFPYPLDVLLCQRSNLVRDRRLKRKYSTMIFIVIILYFIGTIIFGSLNDLKLSEYVLGLFIPALSGYILGIEEGIEHFNAAKKREKLEEKINILSDNALKNIKSLNIKKLREIQNCIFEFRKGPLVSDWFYQIFRNTYENNMISALNNFKRKLKKNKQ